MGHLPRPGAGRRATDAAEPGDLVRPGHDRRHPDLPERGRAATPAAAADPDLRQDVPGANGNIDQFLDSLVAGDIAGLAGPGPYAFSSYQRKAHGTAAQPIVLTSMDTNKPATIAGRFVTYGGDPSTPPGDYWTLRYLGIDGRTSDASSMTIQSRGVRLEQVDFSNWATNIGIIVQSTANDFTIANSRIHDVGPINPRDNMSHGVYDEGNTTHIIDTLVYRCADRGIQDRGGHGSIYEWVTLALNGEGVIFGDDRGAVNCPLRKSILVNQQVADRYLIEALGNANSGNVVDDCFIWSASAGRRSSPTSPRPSWSPTRIRPIRSSMPTGCRPPRPPSATAAGRSRRRSSPTPSQIRVKRGSVLPVGLFRRRAPRPREQLDVHELRGAADSLTGWTYSGRTDWRRPSSLLCEAANEIERLRAALQEREAE